MIIAVIINIYRVMFLFVLSNYAIKAPVKMIGQLKSISVNLTDLSKGNHDGPYQYDLDMVHQRLVHAIRNGITWVQNNYTNEK